MRRRSASSMMTSSVVHSVFEEPLMSNGGWQFGSRACSMSPPRAWARRATAAVFTRRMDKLCRNPGHHAAVEGPGVGDGQGPGRAGEGVPHPPLDTATYASLAADALVLKVRLRRPREILGLHASAGKSSRHRDSWRSSLDGDSARPDVVIEPEKVGGVEPLLQR